ncbi:MAG: queuosine precursor transporter [Saprospiraceae bacterium]|jgi:uncharacterized PurR-regulated membrane protein YhhQ (DUF165 family)|uniref:queuosine precursor transporter n=1 Tax=Candidatus Brachybacter algidus TaxID=2982024 RepID=UPI001B45B53D|nr:queuosine precursor transporter [Candidatus Brachybacter algidus]MBP7306041.1 queuosine precursor transporter [Saprospiraceae bacterium]MBK6371735.1 queuosine precursor transporter [Candidatus Brachybacter algidus]MBK6448926.1 queuosine precursor transporter [Candidatus Brachybacter algidus]MBK8357261.1 queuosine precursor transporter [Candidatus Brachybacter algidus]MBK8843330.1 queuosine precursor transporter [Candidatus Brachybacter algidus]
MSLSKHNYLNKENTLFYILGGIFISNAILAELIGVKIFSIEHLFGLDPVNMTFFGKSGLSFSLTTGVILWPVVFIMTDIINEYYGPKGIKFLSYFTVVLILYSFLAITLAIHVPPADFWPKSHLSTGLSPGDYRNGVANYDSAFHLVFGQGLYIIIGSVVAFLVSQVIDVYIFHKIKQRTGEKTMWMRSTGSTLVSQLIDSFVVLFIAFYIGAGWDMRLVLAIGFVNYIYKFTIAILVTPLLYVIHNIIEKFLGEEIAERLKREAMG